MNVFEQVAQQIQRRGRQLLLQDSAGSMLVFAVIAFFSSRSTVRSPKGSRDDHFHTSRSSYDCSGWPVGRHRPGAG
jgi:hypothetical protein